MLDKLGKYQLEELLGEGAFAWVYRATDADLGRAVALKVLKPAWLNDAQALSRFKQEARTMANLHHPNIAVIYEVGEADGQVYLAQFLVDGESLAARLRRGGLAWAEMLRILQPVAAALDYAHSQGVIHRDIKPPNILLAKNGQPYLGDFGLVRAAEGSASLSASAGGLIGTPAYMAPEQWEGQPATPATDVYALSCVAVEMLTGRMLFDGSTPAVVMKQHLIEGPRLPEQWPAGIPAETTAVLQRGLTEKPGERIQSADELVTALAGLTNQTSNTVGFSSSPPPPAPKAGPNKALWGGVAAVGLVLLGIIAFFALNPPATDDIAAVSSTATMSAPNPTNTPTLTETPTPTPITPTPTHTPTSTNTPAPTVNTEATIVAAVEATRQAEPTETLTPPPTHTPTPTPTDTPTYTPTPTNTPLPTKKPSAKVIPKNSKKIKIGFLAGVQHPFYSNIQRGAEQAATNLGVELVAQIPESWDATVQTPMLNAMVARGDLDALFLAPVDKDAMIVPLRKAYDAGLPIITVDTFIGDGDYANGPVMFPLSFIASDNELGGKLACEALADAIGKKGKVYIQNVKPGISSTDAREVGCKAALAEYPDITLVGVDYNDGDPSKAQAQVEATLQKNPDLGGIFSINDSSSQGVGQAVENKGLSGKVKIVAFDATETAIELLRKGTVDIVIAQKPSEMGSNAVEMAVTYLNGETNVPKRIVTGYQIINRDNMNDPNVAKFFY